MRDVELKLNSTYAPALTKTSVAIAKQHQKKRSPIAGTSDHQILMAVAIEVAKRDGRGEYKRQSSWAGRLAEAAEPISQENAQAETVVRYNRQVCVAILVEIPDDERERVSARGHRASRRGGEETAPVTEQDCHRAGVRSRSQCGLGDTPGRIRTFDLCLRRAALYPLSYGRREWSV